MKSAPSTYACLDRVARDRVVASMDRFLYGNATAFEFDEEIFAASEEAIDETVKELVYELWHFYDDVTDHKVALSRSEWDYLQRIKLVLQSNYIAAVTKTNIWLPAQLAAFVVVCLYAYSIQALGFGYANFLLLAIPAGIASMLISRWRRQSVKKCTIAQRSRRPLYEIIAPFNSLEELAEVRQATPKFSKQRYPGETLDRPIRSGIGRVIMAVSCIFTWIVFSPFVLLFQTLPECHSNLRLVHSQNQKLGIV